MSESQSSENSSWGREARGETKDGNSAELHNRFHLLPSAPTTDEKEEDDSASLMARGGGGKNATAPSRLAVLPYMYVTSHPLRCYGLASHRRLYSGFAVESMLKNFSNGGKRIKSRRPDRTQRAVYDHKAIPPSQKLILFKKRARKERRTRKRRFSTGKWWRYICVFRTFLEFFCKLLECNKTQEAYEIYIYIKSSYQKWLSSVEFRGSLLTSGV